jgi:MFS family permease
LSKGISVLNKLKGGRIMHYAWVIAFTGTLVTILAHGFGRMAYSVLLPPMRDSLNLSYTQLGLIATGNFIGYLAMALIGGFLASRFGTRKLIFVSLLIMGISLFLTGTVNSFLSAFLLRLITGMGNGSSYVPIMALPAAWFFRKKGFATGIVSAGIGTGLFLSGLILPPIIGLSQNGWRYAWYTLGGCVFIGSWVVYLLLRDTPAEKGLLPYGMERPLEKQEEKIPFFSALREVFKKPELWKLGFVYFMYGFSYIIFLTFFVAYLNKEIGIPLKQAGLIFGVLGILSIFCGVIFGGISDLLGRSKGSGLAYGVLALSYLVAALWKSSTGGLLAAIIFGISAFSIPTIMAAAAGDVVGGKLAPGALGFITLFFGIGQALGPYVGGAIKDLTATFATSFLLGAIISIVGSFLSLVFIKK